MENKKFNNYGDYESKLVSGKGVQIKRTLYANDENLQDELTNVLNSDYEKDLVNLQEQEQLIYEDLKKQLDNWQVIAEKIQVLQMAQQYNKDCEEVEKMQTTNNEYTEEKDGSYINYTISNKSYRFLIRLYEYTKYTNGEMLPIKWEVSYYLRTNRGNKLIASVEKTFKEKEKALKYIEGRKKHYKKYFIELYQPIRNEDIEQFKSCGKLIKHYRVEE